MRFFADIKIILNNLKGIFLIIGLVMLLMALLSYYLGYTISATAFGYGAVIGIGMGLLLRIAFPGSINPELKHAMIIAALAYLIVPLISMIPYVLVAHMTPVDAFFEAISGWTGTGFSMIDKPESVSPMIQLWRSLTQWIGGLGVIVLMVSILIRPGTSTYMLYKSETRTDKIHPSIGSTIKTIWGLYVGFTITGLVLLYAAGLPIWDALNLSMTAIGTGGFSIYGASLATYDSALIEILVLLIIMAGSIPFVVFYKTFQKGLSSLFNDSQVRTFIGIILVGATLLIIENYYFYGNLLTSVRYSGFQFISAITSAGFQTTDITQWSQPALLIMTLAAVTGGCAGSTTGGIKIARVIFLKDQVRLWFAKVLRSKNSVTILTINDKRVTEDLISSELTEATFISFLWVVCVFLSVFLLSNIVGSNYDLGHVLFDVSAAMGNTGISSGIINPGLSDTGKIIIIVDMWVGRLEIIPVMLLVRYVFKGFRF